MGTDAFPGDEWARHKQQKALSQYELNQVREDKITLLQLNVMVTEASYSYQLLIVTNVC